MGNSKPNIVQIAKNWMTTLGTLDDHSWNTFWESGREGDFPAQRAMDQYFEDNKHSGPYQGRRPTNHQTMINQDLSRFDETSYHIIDYTTALNEI